MAIVNKSVSLKDQRIALRVFASHIQATESAIQTLDAKRKKLSDTLLRLLEFQSQLKDALEHAEDNENKLIESLKKLPNIGEAAVYLANLSPNGEITAQYAKKMISDRAGLGSAGAIFAYFSRTDDFETIDRGKYKLCRQHSIPSPVRLL